MSKDAGSFDFVDDAIEDLDASGRDYIIIVSHGSEYVVSGNLSKEHAQGILKFSKSPCLKDILTEISNNS